MPLWLFRRALEVQGYYCTSPWEYTFRIYHIVSACLPIFEYAENGNIESLKALVRRDPSCLTLRTTAEGTTPLHVAIESGQVEIARFLISQGANPHEQTLRRLHTPNRADSCFDLLTQTLIFKTHSAKTTLDLLHLLVVENDCDDLVGNASIVCFSRWLNDSTHLTELDSSSCFQMIQRNIWPPYQCLPLRDRLGTAIATLRRQPQRFWDALGQRNFDEECIVLAIEQGLDGRSCGHGQMNPLPDLLSSIADLLVASDCHSNGLGCRDPSMVLETCRDIFHRYISVGGIDILVVNAGQCLMSFVKVFLNWMATFANLGLIWDSGAKLFAQELIKAGVDRSRMSAIGRRARHQLRGSVIEQGVHRSGFWCTHQDLTIRLMDIKYGPTSQDWSIWISHNKDEYGGSFWENIEQATLPERAEADDEDERNLLPIPGAWVDDPKYSAVSFVPETNCQWDGNTLKRCDERRCIASVLSSSRRKRRRLVRYVGLSFQDTASSYHKFSLEQIMHVGRLREQLRRVLYGGMVEKKRQVGESGFDLFMICRNMSFYAHGHFED